MKIKSILISFLMLGALVVLTVSSQAEKKVTRLCGEWTTVQNLPGGGRKECRDCVNNGEEEEECRLVLGGVH